MEECQYYLLKQLMKQDNDLQEIRTTITVLSKTFKNGLIIGRKSPTKKDVESSGPVDESKNEN